MVGNASIIQLPNTAISRILGYVVDEQTRYADYQPMNWLSQFIFHLAQDLLSDEEFKKLDPFTIIERLEEFKKLVTDTIIERLNEEQSIKQNIENTNVILFSKPQFDQINAI